MLVEKLLILYVVLHQDLESSGGPSSHTRSSKPAFDVRTAQADLLPVEGRACFFLLLSVAYQCNDLEAALLLFGELEHTLAESGGQREGSSVIPRPRKAFLSKSRNAANVWYSIQRARCK